MKTFQIFNLFLIIIFCIFIGCVSKEPQKPPENVQLIETQPPKIGTLVEWNNNEFGRKFISVSTLSKEIIDGELSYVWQNPDLNVVSIMDLETRNFKGRWSKEDKRWNERAKPHVGRFQSPLWVGKIYPSNYRFSTYKGWSGDVRTLVNIRGWETVTVPAGTFKALKVVQGSNYFLLTNWHVPELGITVKWHMKDPRGVSSAELVRLEQP